MVPYGTIGCPMVPYGTLWYRRVPYGTIGYPIVVMLGIMLGVMLGGLAGGGCPGLIFWCPCFRNASALRRKRRAGILKFSAMRRKSFARDPGCDPCYVLPRNLPRGFRELAICLRATPHVHTCSHDLPLRDELSTNSNEVFCLCHVTCHAMKCHFMPCHDMC